MTTKQDYISNVTKALRHLGDGIHPEHTQIEEELADRCLNLVETCLLSDAECKKLVAENMELRHRLKGVGA